ncbi:MAG TPA: type II secretion system protein [Gaiellaceae bacterium]|nr:type II secretion system protein [Gaiellaceae bacterium]
MIARLRSQEGFGLIELLVSMMMLNIGILAIVASFNSGALALKRAGEVSTASVVADKQMELYRALKYTEIALDTTAVASANADTTYQCDVANKIAASGPCGGANQQTQQLTTCATLTAQCNPRQTVQGPDSRSYRVDTYVISQTPPTGRAVKLVTIVVRRSADLHTLARVASSFDESSGL